MSGYDQLQTFQLKYRAAQCCQLRPAAQDKSNQPHYLVDEKRKVSQMDYWDINKCLLEIMIITSAGHT